MTYEWSSAVCLESLASTALFACTRLASKAIKRFECSATMDDNGAKIELKWFVIFVVTFAVIRANSCEDSSGGR